MSISASICACEEGHCALIKLTESGPVLRLCLVAASRSEHAFAIWSAAHLFAALAAAPGGAVTRALARPVSILELGAGSGALSLHLLATGAVVHATATDRPHVLPRLAHNVAANAPADSAYAAALEWGEDPTSALLAAVAAAGRPPDVILGTDLVVSEYKVAALARTTAALALLSELLLVAASALVASVPLAASDAAAAAAAPPPPAWPPPWRQAACRILLLNQLREASTQAAFEATAARLLSVRRGGGGAVLAAARAGGDAFVLYRMRVRRDVCAADVGLPRESLVHAGLLTCAAAPRLFCGACRGGGANGDTPVPEPLFCALCGAGRPLAPPQPPPPPQPSLAAHLNPLSASSRALLESGLSRMDVAAVH